MSQWVQLCWESLKMNSHKICSSLRRRKRHSILPSFCLSLTFAPNKVSKEFSRLVCLYLLTSLSLLSPPLALHWSFSSSRSPMTSSWLNPIVVDKDTPHSSVFILSYFSAACRLWAMPFLRHSSPPWSGFLLTFLPITLTPLHKPFFLCSSLRW